jgi:ABC-type nitrate/sulfonate/bicarbonate transport system ATPase subunit
MSTYSKNEIILEVENVSLSYDKPILRDINFRIHNITRPNVFQGQVVSLIGKSGIGKTQLFKILAGLQKPDKGTVKIGAALEPVQAGMMGIVSQNYILFQHRTVEDNLTMGINASGEKLSDKEVKDKIDHYAHTFDLKEHLKKYPQQLSGGQKQRVSILQQILTKNKFILLDEPFSGLDVLMIDKVIDLLVKAASVDDLNTLIIVSHDIENSLAISDTAFILSNKNTTGQGATITKSLDLIEMGFAWKENIKADRGFQEMVLGIKDYL